MPIKPENKDRYPRDWPRIVLRIRKRSGGRCEFVHNGDRCEALQGEPHPITGSKVVLTVAHLDHTPENVDDDNLLDSCQRCHNRYDGPHRSQTRRETRKKEENARQGRLFYQDGERDCDICKDLLIQLSRIEVRAGSPDQTPEKTLKRIQEIAREAREKHTDEIL